MKRRSYERIQLDMKVSFLRFKKMYSGTLKNVSKSGMYIESDLPLPFYFNIDVHIPLISKLRVYITLDNNVFGFPVRVTRLVKDGDSLIGMGVMLLNSPPLYMDFLRGLTTAN